jgi:predicted GNAT family acetyltransferase
MAQVTDNTAAGRFELIEQGQVAHADYRLSPGRLVIDYVFSPMELRGRGAAGRLMQGVVDSARARGLRITPLCGYAAAWLKRHPEVSDLLA